MSVNMAIRSARDSIKFLMGELMKSPQKIEIDVVEALKIISSLNGLIEIQEDAGEYDFSIERLERGTAGPRVDGLSGQKNAVDDIPPWQRISAASNIPVSPHKAPNKTTTVTREVLISKVLKFVGRHGPISENQLLRRGVNSPNYSLKLILEEMVSAGMIEAIRREGGYKFGRPTVKYVVAKVDPQPEQKAKGDGAPGNMQHHPLGVDQ